MGARGFKFALGKDFSKKVKIKEKNQSPIQNNNKFKLKLDNKILPEISHYTKNTTNLFKSQSQMNINEKSNLNFVAYKEKDYNDKLTPININKFKSNFLELSYNNKYIFSSLSSPKINKKIKNISNGINLDSDTSNARRNEIFKKGKVHNIHQINANIPQLILKRFHKYNKLNGLKKIKNKNKNHSVKSYFKAVESVFIYPEQIYEVLNDNNKIKDQKHSFDAYENNIKEKIEQNNEFKEDQKNILFEEKAKEKLINSKDFYNYLINREYFYQTQINKNIFKEKDLSDDKQTFKNKMNYLKNIALIKESNEVNSKTGMLNKNNSNIGHSDTHSNEDNSFFKKKIEEENIEKVRIDGKTYILKNQMEQIARKILNKCKVYNEIK